MQVRSKLQESIYKKVGESGVFESSADQCRIAQEVADEFHKLRAAQQDDSLSQPSDTPCPQLVVGGQSPAPPNGGRSSVSSHSSFGGPYNDPNQPRWLDLAEDEFVNDQTFHAVTVSSSRVLKLFFQYVYWDH